MHLRRVQDGAAGVRLWPSPGAKPLTPETSTNESIGLALTPRPRLSITLDGYRIEMRDRTP
ncbi:MAG: hypothetical protein DI526_08760 [Caulobacter segnis]|uniref:Uncharacterized protein n=1 Tax=Caulobacter segnis TaxID=88688 RepID=A0A2W5XC29_9CAUL|nr:MAG: hypothetical protein DI526_08760 [Caulobacter segnis]